MIFHVLPPFGAPGACLDYDETCDEFEGLDAFARCWLHEPERGVCPFLD